MNHRGWCKDCRGVTVGAGHVAGQVCRGDEAAAWATPAASFNQERPQRRKVRVTLEIACCATTATPPAPALPLLWHPVSVRPRPRVAACRRWHHGDAGVREQAVGVGPGATWCVFCSLIKQNTPHRETQESHRALCYYLCRGNRRTGAGHCSGSGEAGLATDEELLQPIFFF